MIGLKRKTVNLVPHDKRWIKSFESEKKKIKKILGKDVIVIEHEGSTSVFGLIAKPVIDIAVGMRRMKNARKYVRLMESAGYFWRPNWGRFDQRILFAKGNEKKRTHYIHLFKYKGAIWKQNMAFRDYLRAHPKRVKLYAQLKLKLAKRYSNDRPSYTKSKSEFIKKTLEIASNQK